jgi:hypothetical protein
MSDKISSANVSQDIFSSAAGFSKKRPKRYIRVGRVVITRFGRACVGRKGIKLALFLLFFVIKLAFLA